MKKLMGLLNALIIGILYRPSLLMAKDDPFIVQSPEAADSSHMEMDFMATDAVVESSGSGNTYIIILAVLVVLGAVSFFIFKRKRKSLSPKRGQ